MYSFFRANKKETNERNQYVTVFLISIHYIVSLFAMLILQYIHKHKKSYLKYLNTRIWFPKFRIFFISVVHFIALVLPPENKNSTAFVCFHSILLTRRSTFSFGFGCSLSQAWLAFTWFIVYSPSWCLILGKINTGLPIMSRKKGLFSIKKLFSCKQIIKNLNVITCRNFARFTSLHYNKRLYAYHFFCFFQIRASCAKSTNVQE